MSKIEVQGTFVFSEGGNANFIFGDDKSMPFGSVTNMEELRAALVGIATFGTEAATASILRSGPTATASPQAGVYVAAHNKVEEALRSSERKFRDHQIQTERALQQAQKDYESATTNICSKLEPTN